MLDGTRVPGSSQLFNNHIPVDPMLTGVVAVTKTTPLMNVTAVRWCRTRSRSRTRGRSR